MYRLTLITKNYIIIYDRIYIYNTTSNNIRPDQPSVQLKPVRL